MNILLLNVPNRNNKSAFMLPLGLLYVGRILESSGNNVIIKDPYVKDLEIYDETYLDGIINDFKPVIIGFGGVSTSYSNVKKISNHIAYHHPEILQIAGGALSADYKLLLTRTGIDVVFHGETEISIPLFLDRLDKYESYYDIEGISFFINGSVVRNKDSQQVTNLDNIPLPAYHLVDVHDYLLDNQYSGGRYIQLLTSRGCTNGCIFCYRHMRGHRQNSIEYVMGHLKFLVETYDIHDFSFIDEYFNKDYEWVMSFCDALEDSGFHIKYIVDGMRVSNVDKSLLTRLMETGCVSISYGQESGSERVLRDLRKGVTVKQNRDVTNLTRSLGIHNTVQLVIGSPRETLGTIYETIRFLKETDSYKGYTLNYLLPLPETPIWGYVEENGLIPDFEEYLDRAVKIEGHGSLVNLTCQPDFIWRVWDLYIRFEMKCYYYLKVKSYGKYLVFKSIVLFLPLLSVVLYRTPSFVKDRFNRLVSV